MHHLSTDTLMRLNTHQCDLHFVKQYTSATNRPDLILADGNFKAQADVWTPAEFENAHKWKHEKFDYKLTSLGFRENTEIPEHIDLAVFGCSFTFGVGLPLNGTWHKVLSKKHDIVSYNFGTSGSSIKSSYDIFSIVSRYTKIRKAIFLMPTYERQLCAVDHIHDKDKVALLDLIPIYDSIPLGEVHGGYYIRIGEYYKNTPVSELQKKMKDDIYNIELLAKMMNIEAFISSWDRPTYNLIKSMDLKTMTILSEWINPPDYDSELDKARDIYHPGFKHHKYWAEQIENQVFK